MRKLKRESSIIYRKGVIAIIERVKNDNNGNPKFQVQFINENELAKQQTSHQTTLNNQYYSFISYNIELDVEKFIDNNIIENYQ